MIGDNGYGRAAGDDRVQGEPFRAGRDSVGRALVPGLSDQRNRQLEEMMDERGVEVDHSTLNRWSAQIRSAAGDAILRAQAFGRIQLAIGRRTCVKVRASWKCTVQSSRQGRRHPVDFLLTAKRDCKAALRLLRRGDKDVTVTPINITIDESGANTAAIESYNTDHKAGIEMRQIKYLNNDIVSSSRITEAIKQQIRPMLGFKSISGPPSRDAKPALVS